MSSAEMIYRPLGRCGTRVSALGLGGWLTFGKGITELDQVKRMIHRAFDAGVNFFDIADVYARGESERAMGSVLRDLPRHELVISTKVFFPMSDEINDRGLSRKHITESIDGSLKRIGTDYLDIYFCHRFDPDTPLEETARTMDDLVHRGKILYWGSSHWQGAQLHQVAGVCERYGLVRPQVEQPQYSLLKRRRYEKDTQPAAEVLEMGLVTWSPLGMGLLTGKYDRGMPRGSRMHQEEWLREGLYTEANLQRVREFKVLADRLGCSRAQLALAWVAGRRGVSSVITGASRPEQLEENLQGLKVVIPPEMAGAIEELFPVEPA